MAINFDIGTELKLFEYRDFGGGSNSELDPISIPPNACWDTKNTIFERGTAAKRIGYAAPFITGLVGQVQMIEEFIDNVQKQWVIIVTTKRVYVYDVAAKTTTDKTPTGGDLTGVLEEPVSGVVFFGKFFVTNYRDRPFYWDGGAGLFLYLTVTGAPLTALSMIAFQAHLIWFNIVDAVDGNKPFRAVWSDFQNGLVYNSGEAGAADLEDSSDAIIGVEFSSNFLAIGREKSIYTSQFVGSPFFYRFDRKVENNGIIATKSMVRTPIGIVGLSNANIISFAGAKEQLVGQSIIRDLLLLSNLFIKSAFAIYDDSEQKWKLHVSHRADGKPDTIYEYSTLYGTWAKHNFGHFITAVGKYKNKTFPLWTDFPNPWSTYSVVWGTPLTSSIAPQIVYGDENGNIYNKTPQFSDNGVAIEAYFNTWASELDYPGFKEVQIVQPIIKKQIVGSLTIFVFASDDGETFTQYGPYTVNMAVTPTPKIFPMVWGRWFYFRIFHNTLNQSFEIKKLRVFYMPGMLIDSESA